MSTTATATLELTGTPALRVRAENPNHHLWNNHGTWFLHYTIHPTPFTKERVRRSLGTKDPAVARERRDVFLRHLTTPVIIRPLPRERQRIVDAPAEPTRFGRNLEVTHGATAA